MKKKITKKTKREAQRVSNLKTPEVARQETARRLAQASKGKKVVLMGGFFSVADMDHDAPEARASRSERVRRNGAGSPAGLPEGFARTLARKLQAARDRRLRRA